MAHVNIFSNYVKLVICCRTCHSSGFEEKKYYRVNKIVHVRFTSKIEVRNFMKRKMIQWVEYIPYLLNVERLKCNAAIRNFP